MKKAYYRLSLQVHPDRVADDEKDVATEKFKVLSAVHGILSDSDKRALYDDKGLIDEDEAGDCNWAEMWKMFFKPISTSDIDKYQREYTGSELERADIRKAYERGKGCINYMMNSVPFMDVEDEPRIALIVREWIDAGEVPDYKAFTDEPASKRNRRHKKYARESREAKQLKSELTQKAGGLSLEQQIMKRQSERASGASGFFDKLMAKYADMDDDDEFTPDDEPARKRYKKSVPTAAASKKSTASAKATKAGRVDKSKNGKKKG